MIQYSSEDIGKAFKIISQRLRQENERISKLPPEPVSHICSNCKHCHGKEGYDQQWGYFFRCHCWCDKGKDRMDTWNKKTKYWNKPCELFEEGEGKYDEIPGKEKEKLPH